MMRTRLFSICLIYFCLCNECYGFNQSDILFNLFNSTQGESWINQWEITTIYNDPCSLRGVHCNASSELIDALTLSSNNLNGTLPKSIANLTFLSIIDLHNNSLQSSIPSELFSIDSLNFIDLSNNLFSQSFILPSVIGANLQQIHLNHNQLIGQIPFDIDRLTNLSRLSLNDNAFSSQIPSSLFNLQHLEVLKLQNNHFSSSISFNFSNANNLKFAYFHQNKLNGAIPFLPPNIIGVTFHKNDFSFNEADNYLLADFLCDLNKRSNLKAITIYSNRNLYGSLCSFNSSNLQIFMAHSCQITKNIPSSIHFVPSHVSLINNRLSSIIPSDFVTPYNSNSTPLGIALFAQGNKLKFDIGTKIPSFITESALNANSMNLFYTNQLKFLEYMILAIVFCIVLFLMIYNVHRYQQEQKKKLDPIAYM